MKIKHLITIGIVLLALIASVASASILIVSGGQSINISPLYKGLVGHWKLDSEAGKVGISVHTNANAVSITNEANSTSGWSAGSDGGTAATFASQSGEVNNSDYAFLFLV